MGRALPSALALAAVLAGRGVRADGAAEVKQLLAAGKEAEAEARARGLLTAAEAAPGAESVEAAEVIDLLVLVLYRAGKAEAPETRALAERAVRIKEARLPLDDPRQAASWNQLATILHATGDPAGALAGFRKVLAARERAFGPESPRLAGPLSNVASACRDLGDHAEAKIHYQRALALLERDREP